MVASGGFPPERSPRFRSGDRQSPVRELRRHPRGDPQNVSRASRHRHHGHRPVRRIHRERPPQPPSGREALLHMRGPLDAERLRAQAQGIRDGIVRDGGRLPHARCGCIRIRCVRIPRHNHHRDRKVRAQIRRLFRGFRPLRRPGAALVPARPSGIGEELQHVRDDGRGGCAVDAVVARRCDDRRKDGIDVPIPGGQRGQDGDRGRDRPRFRLHNHRRGPRRGRTHAPPDQKRGHRRRQDAVGTGPLARQPLGFERGPRRYPRVPAPPRVSGSERRFPEVQTCGAEGPVQMVPHHRQGGPAAVPKGQTPHTGPVTPPRTVSGRRGVLPQPQHVLDDLRRLGSESPRRNPPVESGRILHRCRRGEDAGQHLALPGPVPPHAPYTVPADAGRRRDRGIRTGVRFEGPRPGDRMHGEIDREDVWRWKRP